MRAPAIALVLASALLGCDSGSSTEVFTLDEVEEAPRPIGGWARVNERFAYPDFAARAGIEGNVRVRLVVTQSGESTEAVIQQSPNDALSLSVLVALRETDWVPGRVSDERVAVGGEVCARLRLASGASGTGEFGWCGS